MESAYHISEIHERPIYKPPGVIVNTLDGGLTAAFAPQDDSILVIGTAGQGVVNTPYQVTDRALAAKEFGFSGNRVSTAGAMSRWEAKQAPADSYFWNSDGKGRSTFRYSSDSLVVSRAYAKEKGGCKIFATLWRTAEVDD